MEFLRKLGLQGQMILMAVAMIAIIGVGYKFWPNLEEQGRQIEKRETKLAGLQEEISKGKNLEKKLPALKAEVAKLEAQLDELKTIIPPVRGDASLIRKLSELAQRSRLKITKIDPLRLQRKEFYEEYPISLDVEANYHDLGLFFDRLSRESRIFNVETVNLDQQLTSSTSIKATFKAKTFIYREGPPPEETPAQKRSGRRGRRS